MKRITEIKTSAKLASLLLTFLFLVSFCTTQLYAGEKLQDQIEVTGIVTDANTGEPLPGVTVAAKGTTTGTITSLDGEYSIIVSPENIIVFSFIGYIAEEYLVGSNTTIDVTLDADIIGLDEVIVTGYGVQKKSDITGSVASVSSEEINAIPIAGVDQALQGLAAGVNVIPVSGRPGEEAVIQIRGISSVNGIEPLVIIDGIRGSLEDVAPSDISSIEILKDASSAAIYGDSGGNGVILITTKKGKSGKIRTTFNTYQGVENVVNKMELMNTDQWLGVVEEMRTEPEAYTANRDTFANYDWQEFIFEPAYTQNYDITTTSGNDVSTYMFSASYNDQTGIIRNSNYERFTLRLNSEHKLTKRVTFDEKISFINRRSHGLPSWLWNQYYDGPIRQALIMPPDVPDYDENGKWGNSSFGRSNPLAMLDMANRIEKTNNFNANFGLKIDIIKGLSFTSRFAGGLGFWDNKEYQEAYENTVYDLRTEGAVMLLADIGRTNSYTLQELLQYDFSIASAHNVSILAGMEMSRDWGYSYGGQRFMAPNTPDYLQYFVKSINDTASNQIIDGGAYEGRSFAYLGRLNYDYKGKYLFTANARYSGRSSFGPNNRWGFFPSFSVGWKFSEEDFIKDLGLFSFGKLRFGYGEVGTYGKSGYPYESFVYSPVSLGYPFNGVTSSSGAAPLKIPNAGLHWETIHMFNIGVDLALLQNRLSVTAEYYSRVNEDMIMTQNVPYINGTFFNKEEYPVPPFEEGFSTNPEVNIGSLKNSGFELTVGYKDQIGDLKYSFNGNVSTLKNEVLELATDSLPDGKVHTLTPLTLTRVGGSVSEFWGYETDGIYTREDCEVDANGDYVLDVRGRYRVINQPKVENADGSVTLAQPTAQPGDVRWVDANGDGKVLTDEDKVSLGSPLPKLTFGFGINLEWKGIDLAAQFTGTYGNKIFNGSKQYLMHYHDKTNRLAAFSDRYVDADLYKNDPYTGEPVLVLEENIDTEIPRNFSVNYVYPSDFYVEDGSYLRLRNLTIGYTIPSSITNIIKIERLRVYVGGRNLKTWTKYTGTNPEIGDGSLMAMGIDASIYPVTKMYLAGLNITF